MANSTGTETNQGTQVLVYAPTIEAYISTKNGIINVSADITKAQVKRVENGVSQAMLQLDNAKGKYGYQGESGIQRMDKIVIYLKRVTRIQVFSGYLDSVPFLDLYPTTAVVQASCTLKRLLYTYWDPGLTPSQDILDQTKYQAQQSGQDSTNAAGNTTGTSTTANGQTTTNSTAPTGSTGLSGPDESNQAGGTGTNASTQTGKAAFDVASQNNTKLVQGIQNPIPSQDTLDSGLGPMLVNVLVKVGGWDKDSVKVAKFPADFLKFSIATIENKDFYLEAVKQLQQLLGFNDSSGGGGGASGAFSGGISKTAGVFGGVPLNAEQLTNADIIAGVAKSKGITVNGVIIGIMVSMTECSLINSCVARDHDSVGLFQQRPSSGWGTVQQCCDPAYAASQFYDRPQQGLKSKVPNYDTMTPWMAAQTVQVSAFHDGSNYHKYYEMAKAVVATANTNTSGTAAPAPNSGATGTPASAPLSGPNETNHVGQATTTPAGTTGGAVYAADGVHPTSPDKMAADKAIAFALAQVGKPYVWGATGPDSWDCSGLTQAACRAGGVNITRTTATQINDGQSALGQPLQPGMLILPDSGHVILYIGNGQIVEAPEPGKNVRRGPNYAHNPFGVRSVMPPGDPAPADASGSGDTGSGAAASAGATIQPYAYGLFNVMFNTAAFQDAYSYILQGNRALINDQQLIQIVQSICKASLRNFCSGPDGQFMAYYPDYFGVHKTVAVHLRDIEMKNVSIQISDGPLATHVYTPGDTTSQVNGAGLSNNQMFAYLNTQGIATVEDVDLFKMMLNIDPKDQKDYSADAIYKRYGARPLIAQFPMIRNPVMERLQAVMLFMQKWAEQYQTRVDITFMPEIFPGMRVELMGHNLNVYVKEVQHNIDLQSGYTTELVIMAPSTNRNGLPGLPVSQGT